MRPYHRHAAATFGTATLIGLLLAAPAVAAAAGDGGPCNPTLVNDLSDVQLESRPAGETPGEAALTGAGLRVKTPAASSKVSAGFPVKVRPKQVDGMEFRSVAHGSTVVVPSYQLGVDFDGDGKPDAVGSWEAGQNAPQAGPEYDTYQDGAAKYRFTGDLPKPAAAKNPVMTFAEFVAAWPDARIVYFGLNQGRGDAGGDTTWTSVKLKAGKECAVYRWKKPPVETNESPTASPTPTPTPEPSASPSESASPTVSPSTSPSESTSPSPSTGVATASPPAPEGGGGSSLPVTGVKLAGLVLGAAALLGVGMALVMLARRRRVG